MADYYEERLSDRLAKDQGKAPREGYSARSSRGRGGYGGDPGSVNRGRGSKQAGFRGVEGRNFRPTSQRGVFAISDGDGENENDVSEEPVNQFSRVEDQENAHG